VEMPVMNGLESTARIRTIEGPTTTPVPIVGLSGNVRDEKIREAISAGMTEYITKPYPRSAITNVIGRLCKVKRQIINDDQVTPRVNTLDDEGHYAFLPENE